MAQLREIIDYSKANPETEYAKRALMLIQRGDFDMQAKQEGIDLSFARPNQQQVESEQPVEGSNKTTFSNILPRIAESFSEVPGRLEEKAARSRKAAEDAGGGVLAHAAGFGETMGNIVGEIAGQTGDILMKGGAAVVNAIGGDTEKGTERFLRGTPNALGETNEETIQKINKFIEELPIPDHVKTQMGSFLSTASLLGGGKVAAPLEAVTKQAAITGTKAVVEGGEQLVKEGIQQTKALGTQAVKEGKAIASAPYKAAESLLKQPTPKPVENVLRETKAADFDKYVDIGKKATESFKNKSPLEAVGDRAVEALDQIERKRRGLANDKNAIMSQASVGRKPVGNIAVKFRQELNNYLSGKTATEGDSKLVKTINTEAQRLGANPTAQQVDKFIDFAQDQLYTAGRDLTVPVTEATTAALRRMIGRLNTNLKSQLPESYTNVNDRMSKLYGIRDELNVKLGKEGERGGALMKRVFSPSDNNTKKLFADVLEETGIDLVNEATIARFVMESLGDARQASLLEQLQLPKSASPEGILQFMGDKLLAGVNSPEEVLRRAREMTVDGAPKKINKANEAGISVGLATKNVGDNIHPDDLGEMRDFVDYVAGEYKPKNPINLEATVTEIAEKYGITLPKSGKNAALADKFARILDKAKLDQKIITDRRKMRGEDVGPKRDDLGRFTTNEGKVEGAIPKELEPLAQEAKKYKTAEEFVRVPGIENNRIKKMTLFGSQAEGKATVKSDIDVLVSVEDGPDLPKIINKGKFSYMIADSSYADELLKAVRKEGVMLKDNKGITITLSNRQLESIWKKANGK